MNKLTALFIIEACEEIDQGIQAELYENYSGRSMYGSTTTGVTIDDITFMWNAVTQYLMQCGNEGIVNISQHFCAKFNVDSDEYLDFTLRSDNLGMGMIVY